MAIKQFMVWAFIVGLVVVVGVSAYYNIRKDQEYYEVDIQPDRIRHFGNELSAYQGVSLVECGDSIFLQNRFAPVEICKIIEGENGAEILWCKSFDLGTELPQIFPDWATYIIIYERKLVGEIHKKYEEVA